MMITLSQLFGFAESVFVEEGACREWLFGLVRAQWRLSQMCDRIG